jgi:hypothetical protein
MRPAVGRKQSGAGQLLPLTHPPDGGSPLPPGERAGKRRDRKKITNFHKLGVGLGFTGITGVALSPGGRGRNATAFRVRGCGRNLRGCAACLDHSDRRRLAKSWACAPSRLVTGQTTLWENSEARAVYVNSDIDFTCDNKVKITSQLSCPCRSHAAGLSSIQSFCCQHTVPPSMLPVGHSMLKWWFLAHLGLRRRIVTSHRGSVFGLLNA